MRNFYKHQDVASSKSRLHVFWLTFAVMGTAIVTSVVVVYLTLLALAGIKTELPNGNIVDLSEYLRSWPAAVEIMLGCATLLVTLCISIKSYFKVRQLRAGGGAVVAADLGGTEIVESAQLDQGSRRLSNVVQRFYHCVSI